MRISWTFLLAAFVSLGSSVTVVARDDELARHLETMRRRVEDASTPIADRERIALEVAATLERAAETTPTPAARRARLDQSAEWLKAFNDRNPGHAEEREFRRRIALIRMTEAESWALEADLQPTLTDPPRLALQRFQGAETQLRDLLKPSLSAPDDATTHRIEATLARVLTEIAERDPAGKASLEEAVALLESAGDDRTTDGEILRIDLLRRLGRLDEAEVLWKALSAKPVPPPRRAILPVRVRLDVAQRRFDEALELLRNSGEPIAETAPLAVEIRLAQRESLKPGRERQDAEREAFEQVAALREADALRQRPTLFRLARAVKEPAATLPPRFWGTLAEGHFLMGEPEEAARLWTVGAVHAESERSADLAWDFRYRAAAAWFDAGEFAQAATLWNRIERSNEAGALRPKAGLLRATALGRLWKGEPNPAHREEYFHALEDQLRRFPNDPTAGQARYALGVALQEIGEESRAIETFHQVPTGHPRRLDALRAIAMILRQRLEANAAITDTSRLWQEERRAEEQIGQARAESSDPASEVELDLDLVRLQLIPNLPTLTPARASLDRLRAGPLRAETRRRADTLQIERLLREESFADAEKQAREAIASASDADLVDLAEFVDALASNTTGDVMSRRCGRILDQVVEQLLLRTATAAEPQLRERLELWKARSLLFRADLAAARSAGERIPRQGAASNTALRADTFLRLGDFSRAEEQYRRLGRETASGSLSWLAARYGLAVALMRRGETTAARKLIDGTALLDPDLGGSVLKQRFEALRKRLPPP